MLVVYEEGSSSYDDPLGTMTISISLKHNLTVTT